TGLRGGILVLRQWQPDLHGLAKIAAVVGRQPFAEFHIRRRGAQTIKIEANQNPNDHKPILRCKAAKPHHFYRSFNARVSLTDRFRGAHKQPVQISVKAPLPHPSAYASMLNKQAGMNTRPEETS